MASNNVVRLKFKVSNNFICSEMLNHKKCAVHYIKAVQAHVAPLSKVRSKMKKTKTLPAFDIMHIFSLYYNVSTQKINKIFIYSYMPWESPLFKKK